MTGRDERSISSRAPIPHARCDKPAGTVELPGDGASALGHIGIYGYRREALMQLVELEPSPLELCEKLEQLRALQAGMTMGVALVDHSVPGIDTADDLEAFRRRFLQRMQRDCES